MSDATTISTLELEIQSSSKNAESGLNDLINTLGRLKTATKGGLGLTSVVKQLNNLNTATKGINSNSVNNVTGLSRAIQLLGGIKISSTIGKQITEISTALSGANFTGGQAKITELVSALKPLETLGKTSLGSTVNALKKLPEVFDGLKKIDMDAFGQKIAELTTKLKPLADEMQKVSNGFSAFPSKIQRLIGSTNNLTTANNKAAKSYINLYAELKMAATSVVQIGRKIASMVKDTMSYYETINLFSVSMRQYAEEAYDYAQSVSDAMGIDPAQWMKYQGVIMTLATGFGVASDRAYVMSQQMTQLAYDISSFVDIPVDEAMKKLQSGFAGELEPLRAIGYDLSQAKLEAIALSLGIDKSVSSMTQAEKAQLRYYAIMTQVTTAQGDMARTLDSPANQMRILKAQVTQAARAIGGIFIPALNAILPLAIAVAKIIGYLASAISSLFGFKLPEVKDSDMDVIISGAEGVDDALENASESAKKIKSYLLGFDELNVIDPNAGSSGSSDSSVGSGLDFELPTYDFIEGATESRVNQIVEDMKEWLGITDDIESWSDLFDTKLGDILKTVGLIGTGLAAWKISKATLTAINTLKTLTSGSFSWSFTLPGLAMVVGDLNKLKDFVDDFIENGASVSNVAGMISEFAGTIGDAMLILGQTKTAGALKAVQGVGEIISAIADMKTDGINFENVTDAIRGLGNIGVAIGLMTGNFAVAGVSAILVGITDIIHELAENWEAIKKGDWSGVDKATLAIGAVEVIGGVILALKKLKDIKGADEITGTKKVIEDVTTVTGEVSTKTSTLTTKLKDLTKNLGLGLIAVGEVMAAAVLIVGAIWLLGIELDGVAKAWTPVIDNAGTVAIAIGIGTGLLVAVGTVTNTLGKKGTKMIAKLGLGTAILAEIGIATGLFIAEIWAIGKLLDEVGKAWKPVLDNGETIKTAIITGTAILVAIGAVTALLGVAATATGYALPIAIGLGTAILLELGIAAGLFITEIWAIGKGLDKIGKAWQPVLDNAKTIETGIATGTALLIAIGAVTALLGAATIATGAALPIAVGLGTALLVELGTAFKKFTDSIITVANKLSNDLHPELVDLNGKLPTLSTNMKNFTKFMKEFVGEIVAYTVSNTISSIAATVDKFVDFFTTDPIKRLSDEVGEQYDDIIDLIDELTKTIPKVDEATKLLKDYNDAMDRLQTEAGGEQSSGVLGFVLQFAVNVKNTANEWWFNVKKWWGEKVGSVTDFTTNVRNNASTWWSNVKSWWSKDSSAGVDVKVNAKKGWSGTVMSALGISSNYSLGFKLPKIGVNWGTKTIAGFEIKFPSGFYTYAKGGFPDVGEMFIAREAGPELVGNIGSKSAVVNNEQIVDSVSTGVYQAVLAALGSGNGDGDSTQIVINLDGEKIYENQQKIARNRGYNLGMGAFSFG